MRLQIVGGPRDGDYEKIGDRSEARELGTIYVFNGYRYEVTMQKGQAPKLTYRGYNV